MIDRKAIMETVKRAIERGLVSSPPPKTSRKGQTKSGLKKVAWDSILRKHHANLGRILYGDEWWVVRSENDSIVFRRLNRKATYRISFRDLLLTVLQGPIQVKIEIYPSSTSMTT